MLPPGPALEALLLALAGLGWLGLGLALLALAPAWWQATRALPQGERRLYLGALAVAVALRLVVPFTLVRVFTGWELLASGMPGAALPKYGAGLPALLRAARVGLGLAPDDAIAIVNFFAGLVIVAGLPLAARALLRRPWVAAAGALTLATLPLLLRHHRSESALPLAMLAWLVGGLCWALAERGARERGWRWLAVLPLALAAHTRPEFLLAVPVTLAALRRWGGVATTPARGALAALALLTLPQAAWLTASALGQIDDGSLPALARPEALALLPLRLVVTNLALWPHAFPLGLTVCGVWGAIRLWRAGDGDARRVVLLSTAIAVALLTPAFADPVPISLPRLSAPALSVWATAAAALAIAGLPQSLWRRGGALVVAASMFATVPWLFAPTNADHETALVAEAAAALRGAHGTLYALGYDDDGADKVSRHLPHWRFSRPDAALRLRPLRALPAANGGRDALDRRDEVVGPAWVLLGVRCHARADDAGPPTPDFEHVGCRRVRARSDLKPVFERDVPNYGDADFDWWPARPSFRVGLYRLGGTEVADGGGR